MWNQLDIEMMKKAETDSWSFKKQENLANNIPLEKE
jgi:hypothetical protein